MMEKFRKIRVLASYIDQKEEEMRNIMRTMG
jgi:hypothetical protein